MFAPPSPLTPSGSVSRKRRREQHPTKAECIREIGSSIQKILFLSTNDEFRKGAFRALSVTNAQDAKLVIEQKLSGIIGLDEDSTTSANEPEHSLITKQDPTSYASADGTDFGQLSQSLLSSNEPSQSSSGSGPLRQIKQQILSSSQPLPSSSKASLESPNHMQTRLTAQKLKVWMMERPMGKSLSQDF